MTLAKSVLGSLPSYFLSLFAAPKGVIEKLEKIRRNFVWGNSNSGHKMRWIRWELLSKAKRKGGMGLGAINNFNLAMLVKWWWKFLSNPNDLWAKVVGAIHSGNPNSSFSLIPVKKTIAGVWKGIGSVASTLQKYGINLKDKFVQSGGRWLWHSTDVEEFSVKLARMDFELAFGSLAEDNFVFKWINWVPPKVNYLVWRALMGKIASRTGLIRRGVSVLDSSCPRCGLSSEDHNHIFFSCLWSRSIWWSILTWMRISFPMWVSSIKELFDFLLNQPGSFLWKKVMLSVASATFWRIWKARNEKAFEDRFIPVLNSVDHIKEDAFLWVTNRSNLNLDWDKWRLFDLVGLM
ncbi:putative reverse transcriptase zinc-binding domain-containing protein [Helianthus annuus]|uniref:Reverse transcriptase zinc-binding domain-containing protein n=1 Tax=Helianthus annuus TaxID=4232 RepID=A0A9K3MXF1_HELAN|nr:uncharacterized protein LOC110894848 [Helianthus annuus]XP_021997771.1 uncharacterized protein LOC110894848 [Helianthus annuus]XP_035836312.1 uncharacterized protein LOC110894848 [Helianthus annuus]XP_035836313.1 uncharacterized protein LOC110894848 [Helianthus annuus]KAF5779181.1 putative reverse transcriptase zinc-binding domain-containing protein [Helianthus annuus]KAJ0490484.1 putative reverse transcriptase zinc-binding domain-containing protein [Helianthus annuus]KAJ0494700.1 putative